MGDLVPTTILTEDDTIPTPRGGDIEEGTYGLVELELYPDPACLPAYEERTTFVFSEVQRGIVYISSDVSGNSQTPSLDGIDWFFASDTTFDLDPDGSRRTFGYSVEGNDLTVIDSRMSVCTRVLTLTKQ